MRASNMAICLRLLAILVWSWGCGGRQPAPASPVQPEPGTSEPATTEATATEPAATEPAAPGPLPAVECNRQDEFGPAQVSEDDHATRHGAGIHDLSQLMTSKERPVEVCGVQEQLDYLVQARCKDGTQPFATPRDAHRARSGSLGKGGRCGGIIDLYEVPCPEGTYEVYMDLYFCRAGDSF